MAKPILIITVPDSTSSTEEEIHQKNRILEVRITEKLEYEYHVIVVGCTETSVIDFKIISA